MRVKIISDSTCDLSKELVERFDLEIIPLTVNLGADSFLDGQMDTEEIYRYVSTSGNLPKTSAINAEDYREVYEKWTKEGYQIVHFTIGSGFSSCFSNARIAAEDFEEVYPVDSKNLSTGQGLMVLYAAELAEKGLSAKEIAAACEELAPRVEASFVIDRLDYLYKGGRCSALSMFGANLLKLKPSIVVDQGKMHPDKKYRGKYDHVLLQYVRDCIAGREDIDKHRVFITHTKCDEMVVESVKNLVRELCPDFEEVLETTAGATVTTHCGPNTLGVLFIRKA